MLNRSIERDFDISYHRKKLGEAVLAVGANAKALYEVEYDPCDELTAAIRWCQDWIEQFART